MSTISNYPKGKISPTCEVLAASAETPQGKTYQRFCDCPTSFAYPAMGGGYMALCEKHAQKHLPGGCRHIEQLFASGCVWE